ncbi:MAG: hypothetical protein GWQ08_25075 [Verrucomicrobiaceae bacterium]|nr:hypothetical protein [Verrucomicrobiaceae bacterium]
MLAQQDKICLVLILDDLAEGVRRLAQEVLAGSVHTVYIDPIHCGSVHEFGKRLAERLEGHGKTMPSLSEAQAEEIRHLRGSYAFRAETDPRVSIHISKDLSGWTIICEEDVLFALSSANRQIYVKPLPGNWNDALFMVEQQLQSIAYWPVEARLAGLPELETRLLGQD